jgi:hypothetical protein
LFRRAPRDNCLSRADNSGRLLTTIAVGYKEVEMSSRAQEWISFLSDPAHRVDARDASWIAGSDVCEISILIRELRGLSPFSEDQISAPLLHATLEHLPQWSGSSTSRCKQLALLVTVC